MFRLQICYQTHPEYGFFRIDQNDIEVPLGNLFSIFFRKIFNS